MSVQLGRGNTKEKGRFFLNVGGHFRSVAAMLLGEDGAPVYPEEYECLLRARFHPEERRSGGWWVVTPETDGDALVKEIAEVCSSQILPWLEGYRVITEVDWRKKRRRLASVAMTGFS